MDFFSGSPQNHTSQGQPKNKSDVFSLISHILEDELFQKNTVVSHDNEWNDYVDQIVKLMRNLKTDYKDYQMKS